MSSPREHPACLIVGAGLTGLTAGALLQRSGYHPLLLEAGHVPGGRIATFSDHQSAYDSGAQFLTAREPAFLAMVDQWLTANLVTRWSTGFPSPDHPAPAHGHPRYIATHGMDQFAQALASDLPIHTGQRVTRLRIDNHLWHAHTESRQTFTAPLLLLTQPVPQALDLLSTSRYELPAVHREALERVEYDPFMTLLLQLQGQATLPPPGAVQFSTGPISWIADNHAKGISPAPGALTIHADPVFSHTWFGADDRTIADQLIHHAQPWLANPASRYYVRRWRYSRPTTLFPDPCLMIEGDPPVAFAGDAFVAPRIEGAVLSGLAAARSVSTHFCRQGGRR